LLAFVAAERRELEGLVAHVERMANPGWPLDFARLGWLNETPIVMVANGPGPQLAGEAVEIVRNRENIEAMASVGFCGGLQPLLKACDIFVASEVIGAGQARVPSSDRSFKTGTLLSIDRVASTAAEKSDWAATGADAVEMEAAAVAQQANTYGIPFFAVRVVTDTFDESFPLDFNRMRSADGHFSRAKIVAAALRRPASAIPELIKLNKRTKRAAQALGDFLADARF
jgi:adenosylhomocysteine nucleosidase